MFNFFKNLVKKPSSNICLIVGLGNPGDEYVNTRHNLGFKVIDYLNNKFSLIPRHRANSLISSHKIGNDKIFFQKPLSYVNKSGETIKKFCKKENLSKENFVIIYDDLSLPFGKIKIKSEGSSGGHNGIKSIIHSFASDRFLRIKFGIAPKGKINNVKKFVLNNFNKVELNYLINIVEEIANMSLMFCSGSIKTVMNEFSNRQLVKNHIKEK